MLTVKKLQRLHNSKRTNISRHIELGKLPKQGVMSKIYKDNGLDETTIRKLEEQITKTIKLLQWVISGDENNFPKELEEEKENIDEDRGT